MQPKLCVKCKKNVAVVFITRLENGVSRNEGYCLKCARKLGIPQIEDGEADGHFRGGSGSHQRRDVRRLRPESARGGGRSGQSDRYLPLLNQLFSGSDRRRDLPEKQNKEREKRRPPSQNQKAQIPGHLLPEPHRPGPGGKLDRVVGRDTETGRSFRS